MNSWFRSYIRSFLPESLILDQKPVSKRIAREVNLLSMGLLTVLLLIFLLTYWISLERYNPQNRSLNLNPIFLLVFLWGGISVFAYYEFDKQKLVYWLMPGILVGSGCFLGLVSFAAELAIPGVVLQANVSAILSILIIQTFNYFRMLERFPLLESKLIFIGTIILSTIISVIFYMFLMSWIVHAPEHMANPFGFKINTLGVSAGVIILMTILGIFHLDEIARFCSEEDTFEEKMNLATNSLFIVFMLYIFFLGFLAALRGGKD